MWLRCDALHPEHVLDPIPSEDPSPVNNPLKTPLTHQYTRQRGLYTTIEATSPADHLQCVSSLVVEPVTLPDLDSDLVACCAAYASRTTLENGVFRKDRLRYWASRGASLRSDTQLFSSYFDPSHPARDIAKKINVPLVEELLLAMGAAAPGVRNEFVTRLGFGFPVVDDLSEVGVFDPKLSRSTRKVVVSSKSLLVTHESSILRSLQRRCVSDGDMHEISAQLANEVEKGWLEGPYTPESLPVDSFVPIRRFIVEQGQKRRGCDNARPTNRGTRIHTPISLCGVDNAVATALCLQSHGVPKLAMAVLDQSDAYKSLIVDAAQRRYAVIVAVDPETHQLRCYLSNVLCFGTESAVLDYNLLSRFVVCAARRQLGVPTSGYFDDFLLMGREDDAEAMADDFQCLFSRIIGLVFGDAKKRVGTSLTYLGVCVDLSSPPLITCRITDDRKRALIVKLENILSTNSLSSTDAAKLLGQLSFVQQSMCGAVGRAYLHPLISRQYSKSHFQVLGARLREALVWWLHVLQRSSFSRVIDPLFISSPCSPLCVYTDASLGFLGVCILYKQHRYYGGCPSALLHREEVNIQLYETEAVLSAQCFCNRFFSSLFPTLDLPYQQIPQVFFVDSECAQMTLVKGYSTNTACNAMVRSFWSEAVSSGASRVWLERVASAANIADMPSRDLGRIQWLEERGFQCLDDFESVFVSREFHEW